MKKFLLCVFISTLFLCSTNAALQCSPETSFPYEWMATSSGVGYAAYLSAHGYTFVFSDVHPCAGGYCVSTCGVPPGGGLP